MLLVSLNKLSLKLQRLKRKLLAEKKYLKKLINGWLHARRRVGLRNTTGLGVFSSLTLVLCFSKLPLTNKFYGHLG